MAEIGRLITYLLVPSLVLLSFSSPASAWSSFETAQEIKLGVTKQGTISYGGERQYRWFTLDAPGNVSLEFDHDDPPGTLSPEAAWRVELVTRTMTYSSTASRLTDNGVTCSVNFKAPGTYYVFLEGLENIAGVTPARNVIYYLTLSQKNLNVQLMQGSKQTYYASFKDAYDAASSGCTIKSVCVLFDGVVNFDKPHVIKIEGGQDNCFEKEQDFSIIKGRLNVALGTVRVKGLKVR